MSSHTVSTPQQKPSSFDIEIRPGYYSKNYWRDLWKFRELFFILSWRDIKIRYKQTIIGAAWSVIRPVLTMVVFTVVFSRIAKLPTVGNIPYSILVFTALLPWQFFSNAVFEASNSLINNSSLVTKVYFPRLILPASAIITSFVDFAISFCLLGVLMIILSFTPPIKILTIPIFLALAFALSLGFSLLFGALNVKYRDFRYIIPFVVQFGLFISPVGFSSTIVSADWQFLYNLNPMVGVIDGFRWSIDASASFPTQSLVSSVGVTFSFLALGFWYFRKVERLFADNI